MQQCAVCTLDGRLGGVWCRRWPSNNTASQSLLALGTPDLPHSFSSSPRHRFSVLPRCPSPSAPSFARQPWWGGGKVSPGCRYPPRGPLYRGRDHATSTLAHVSPRTPCNIKSVWILLLPRVKRAAPYACRASCTHCECNSTRQWVSHFHTKNKLNFYINKDILVVVAWVTGACELPSRLSRV